MDDAANPGGGGSGHAGGGRSGHGGAGGIAAGGGGSSAGSGSGVDDLDELWPPPPQASRAAAMLASIWVDNRATSEQWTTGIGGVE